MRLLSRSCVLLVALTTASCGKHKDKQATEVETPPLTQRWQYLDAMLDAECACKDQPCSDKVQERAEQEGYRYLPAQLLDEDKGQFLSLVARRSQCAAGTGRGLVVRAREDLAKMQLARIVNGSYARWAMANNKICPESFSDLDRYRSDKSIKDPWGHDLLMLCGSQVPLDAAGGFGILSVGPDGQRDSEDDIRSWELSP